MLPEDHEFDSGGISFSEAGLKNTCKNSVSVFGRTYWLDGAFWACADRTQSVSLLEIPDKWQSSLFNERSQRQHVVASCVLAVFSPEHHADRYQVFSSSVPSPSSDQTPPHMAKEVRHFSIEESSDQKVSMGLGLFERRHNRRKRSIPNTSFSQEKRVAAFGHSRAHHTSRGRFQMLACPSTPFLIALEELSSVWKEWRCRSSLRILSDSGRSTSIYHIRPPFLSRRRDSRTYIVHVAVFKTNSSHVHN